MYNSARKVDKSTKFESHERDEAELEKIGLQLCIYEIYNGQGAWPFLQHGSLYRGISLVRHSDFQPLNAMLFLCRYCIMLTIMLSHY